MRKLSFVFGLFLVVAFMPHSAVLAEESAFAPVEEKSAYQRLVKRPQSELSKLVYLLELLESTGNQVLVDGRTYESDEASPVAKSYLRRHYNGKQKAESWIKEHCYRTRGGNQIIQFEVHDGVTKPLRDVLLSELNYIEAKLA